MKQRTYKQKIVAKCIALGVFVALLILLLALKTNTTVCEFFATTISRWWIFLFGHIFNWVPFSLYEVLLVCAVLGAVVLLVLLIVALAKRRWKKLLSSFLSVAIAVVCFVNVYTITASFSYNREPLPQEVYTEFNSETFTYQEAAQLATLMVQKANYAYDNTQHDDNGNIVYPFSFAELSDMLAKEYQRLSSMDYFSPYTPRGKQILNKWVMSQMHITGVFFAPFGEANVNGNEQSLYLPLTLAHEMAHSKGVMREYEADIVAYYITITSDNPYLYYGASVRLAHTALNMLNYYPTVASENQQPAKLRNELALSMRAGIGTEMSNYYDFWAQFTLLDDIGDFFNDIYLKLQNQQDGTESYVKPGDIVDTGEIDEVGEPVKVVVNFSGKENVLIGAFKNNLIPDLPNG